MSRTGRKERSRQLILDAAATAFREAGFANVTMEEIAQRAGLTRMTIYNLFTSKEEIARSIISHAEAQADPAFRDRITAGESALLLLEDAFVESARWCLANPSIAPLALAGPAEGPSLSPPSGRPSFHSQIHGFMALGQSQNVIRRDKDPAMLAAVLLGAYAQAMLYALSTGRFTETWIPTLVHLIIEGIGARGQAAPVAAPAGAKDIEPDH
jgi:TetR/AcrR family transcriptional regulator, regulator of autoinduction and epiphytic fitness